MIQFNKFELEIDGKKTVNMKASCSQFFPVNFQFKFVHLLLKILQISVCNLPLGFHILIIIIVFSILAPITIKKNVQVSHAYRSFSFHQNMNVAEHELAIKKLCSAVGETAVLSRQARSATSGRISRLQSLQDQPSVQAPFAQFLSNAFSSKAFSSNPIRLG